MRCTRWNFNARVITIERGDESAAIYTYISKRARARARRETRFQTPIFKYISFSLGLSHRHICIVHTHTAVADRYYTRVWKYTFRRARAWDVRSVRYKSRINCREFFTGYIRTCPDYVYVGLPSRRRRQRRWKMRATVVNFYTRGRARREGKRAARALRLLIKLESSLIKRAARGFTLACPPRCLCAWSLRARAAARGIIGKWSG